jgi:Ni/Co efflux regulator RcnB
MSRILSVVVAASLLATGLAVAQDQRDRHDDRGPGDHGARPEAQQRPERPNGGDDHRPPARPDRGPARPDSRPPPEPLAPSMGHRAPHQFRSEGRWRPAVHVPKFVYPPGFRYQRWEAGATLPRVFLEAPYYYDGYAALGLAPPPRGFQWVRYGNDLLLVNLATGRIVEVVDGTFY